MAENSGEAPRGRGPGRPFAPGQSGNPGGKPKRLAELALKISELDDEHRKRLEEIASKGEHKDSIAAIKLLWAYAHGNPSQAITDAEGNSLHLGLMVLPAKSGE